MAKQNQKNGQQKKKANPPSQGGMKMRRKPRLRLGGPVAGSFGTALSYPFSRAAEGARLPDGNPNNSSTILLTRKVTLQSNASGELDVTCLPNLHTTLMSTRASVLGGQAFWIASTGVVDGNFQDGTAIGTFMGDGFDTYALNPMYSRYRIVSYGVRLRTIGGLNTPGEFMIAVNPCKGQVPMRQLQTGGVVGIDDYNGVVRAINTYWSAIGPRNTVENYIRHLGLPVTGSANAAALQIAYVTNMPQHAIMSAAEVSARGAHFRGLPFEGEARNYRQMFLSPIGTDAVDVAFSASGVFNNSTSVMNQGLGVDISHLRCSGHESVIIAGDGFPASTSVATLEYVYHVEVLPNPNFTSQARPTGAKVHVPPSQTLDQALTRIHAIPRISFADVCTQVGDALLGDVEGRAGKAVTRALTGVAGTLARLAIANI